MTPRKDPEKTHPSTTDLLSDYLDGVLPDPESRRLERHLEGCPECSRLLVRLREALSELRAFPRLEVPADFTTRVLERTSLRERAPAPWRVFSNWLGLPRLSPAALTALLAFPLIFLAGTPDGRMVTRETSMAVHQTYSNAVRLYSRRGDLRETAAEVGRRIPGQLEETMEWLRRRIESGEREKAPQPKPGEPGRQSNRTLLRDSTA